MRERQRDPRGERKKGRRRIGRGRSQGQTDGREQEEEGRERGANSGPPISPNDLGQPQRRAGAGPEAAQTWGGGDREPCPAGSRVGVKESGLRVLRRGHSAGSGGRRGAVRGAENSPRRREGMEGHAARRAVRGVQDSLPQGPALTHLAPRRAEAPGPRRSAWRSRGAEQLVVWGGPRRALGRGAAGLLAPGKLRRHQRGDGVWWCKVSVCVCLSIRPPHWARALQQWGMLATRFYTPDPGKDVIGSAPTPIPIPPGVQQQLAPPPKPPPPPPPSLLRVAPIAHSSWVRQPGGPVTSGGGTEDSADRPTLDGSPDLLYVRGQVTSSLWTSCSSKVR